VEGVNEIKIVLISLINLAAISGVHSEGICKDNEAIIFNCEMPKSVSSLCRSKDSGIFTYQINLELSDRGISKGQSFYFSNTPYAGGGEAHIRISRSGYTYYLYDKTVKTEDGPAFSAGIVVYRGERKISNLICSNDASIRRNAYDDITKESYRSIGSK
jgi:hypothetical protein